MRVNVKAKHHDDSGVIHVESFGPTLVQVERGGRRFGSVMVAA